MSAAQLIGIAALLAVVAGPAALALAGWLRARYTLPAQGAGVRRRWRWKLTAMSALLYVLAFNLTFFIQELFLVLPKALTPGLRPTLFHNNHTWHGHHPLASLFQGTGALATFAAARLFLFWMAYSGMFMALPQVAIGAVSTQSDLGMAMSYLGLALPAKVVLALLALAAIPLIAARLARLLLAQAGDTPLIATAGGRHLFVFEAATLPALVALPVIFLFRIPREWTEVVMVPVAVTVVGLLWVQAGAWRARQGSVDAPGPASGPESIAWPLAAVLALLLLFQLLLRPGIRFY